MSGKDTVRSLQRALRVIERLSHGHDAIEAMIRGDAVALPGEE